MCKILQINHGWQFGPCTLQGSNVPVVRNWQLESLHTRMTTNETRKFI